MAALIFMLFNWYNCKVISQMSAVYKNYRFNEFVINPAISGINDYTVIATSVSKQWAKTPGSPFTAGIGGHWRLGQHGFYNPRMYLNKTEYASKDRVGLGGYAMHDRNGPLHSSFFLTSYSYAIPFYKIKSKLSFGISTKFTSLKLNKDELNPLDKNDPYLLRMDESEFSFDMDFGVLFHTKKWVAGISTADLFQTDNKLSNNGDYDNKIDYFFYGYYKFEKEKFQAEPLIVLMYIDSHYPIYELRNKFYFKSFHWLEIGYRSKDCIMITLAYRFSKATISYKYEHSINEYRNIYTSINEISFGFNLGMNQVEAVRKLDNN